MTLRSRQAGKEAPPRKTGNEGEGQAEFQGFKLRKAARDDEQPKTRGTHDFSVKLKVYGSNTPEGRTGAFDRFQDGLLSNEMGI